jgi:hypothetical protein
LPNNPFAPGVQPRLRRWDAWLFAQAHLRA